MTTDLAPPATPTSSTNAETSLTTLQEDVMKAPNSEFQYQPLYGAASIRLLVLQPPLLSDEPLPRCELRHATFKDKPAYQALSYMWGYPEELKPILLNGLRFHIRANLWHALAGLRREIEGQALWVDAICINQADDEERNAQVSLMDFVYSRASCVLIWLQVKNWENLDQDFYSDSFENMDIDFYEQLFRHPYWTRLWIVQEIGLSVKAKVFLGNKSAHWRHFLRIVHNAVSQRHIIKGTYGTSAGSEFAILNLDEKRRGRHGPTNRLETLLESFQYAKCQDPRDKIFGFLGLAHDCESDSIRADYTKPLVEVYAQVLAFFCRRKLFDNGATNELDRSMRLIRFSQLLYRMLSSLEYPATFPLNEEVFQVRGAIGSSIIHLGPTYDDIISVPAASRTWKLSFETNYPRPEDSQALREANEAYIALLLGMNDDDLKRVRSIDPRNMYSRAINAASKWNGQEERWRRQEVDNQIGRVENDQSSISNDHPESPHCQLFLGHNRFMGLAPPGAKIGDLICHFWETDVVALIRNESNMNEGEHQIYRIVGRVHLSTSRLENLEPVYEKWHVPQENAPAIIIQMDIGTLSALTS